MNQGKTILEAPKREEGELLKDYLVRLRAWQEGQKETLPESVPTESTKRHYIEGVRKETWSKSSEREI